MLCLHELITCFSHTQRIIYTYAFTDSILFCSRLGPSTVGSSPLPESSNLFWPLLFVSIPVPVVPPCHLSKDVWSSNWSYALNQPFYVFNGPSIVFHSDEVSSPFPFCIGYVFDHVRHSSLLPSDGTTKPVLTLSIFLSMAYWFVSSFFTNAFVRDHVWHPYVSMFGIHMSLLVRYTGWKPFFLDSWKVPVQKDFSVLSKTLHPAFILIKTSCLVLFSIATVCPRYL